jgi:iron complex transport system substrate-binding protein
VSRLIAILLFMTLLVGCADGEPTSRPNVGRRIVSLSPAVTRMVIDLGLESSLVGVGKHDPVAPSDTAVVGDLYQIDYEKLLRANPTHVFLQPGKRGVPKRLRDFAKSNGWIVRGYDIETVDDAIHALYHVRDGDDASVGAALDLETEARALAVDVHTRLGRLEQLLEGRRVERILLLIGNNPLTAVGPNTFLGELLEIAGGKNALVDESATRYPVLDLERVVTLRPEVVIFVDATTGSMSSQGEKLRETLAGLDIPAVKSGSIHEVVDPVALLPSTSMPRVAATLAMLLHPGSALEIESIVREHETR